MLRYKKYILATILFFSVLQVSLAQDKVKWNIEKSTHFIVYYQEAKEDFIKELVNYAENYYDRIAEDLGLRRYNFWLWDNRAKIYIYNDNKDYLAASGKPSWSVGYAIIREKIIYTYPYARGFFETVLSHEMGHIIFRELVGFYNPAVPLWLDEGVASYQEKTRVEGAKYEVASAIDKGTFIQLEKLNVLNPQLMQDKAQVGLFYAEAVNLVDYLIRQFGKDNFVLFCQRLRDRQNLRDALSATYPFSNLQELDAAWQKYLKNE